MCHTEPKLRDSNIKTMLLNWISELWYFSPLTFILRELVLSHRPLHWTHKSFSSAFLQLPAVDRDSTVNKKFRLILYFIQCQIHYLTQDSIKLNDVIRVSKIKSQEIFQNAAEAALLKFKFQYRKAIFSLSLKNTCQKSLPLEIWLSTSCCPKPAGGIMKCCYWWVLDITGLFPRPLKVHCWRCIFWREKESREGKN